MTTGRINQVKKNKVSKIENTHEKNFCQISLVYFQKKKLSPLLFKIKKFKKNKTSTTPLFTVFEYILK